YVEFSRSAHGSHGAQVSHDTQVGHDTHDTRELERTPDLAIARTVAGLLNARGGILLIGLDDDGLPVGLYADDQKLDTADRERFALGLREWMYAHLGVVVASSVHIDFAEIQ